MGRKQKTACRTLQFSTTPWSWVSAKISHRPRQAVSREHARLTDTKADGRICRLGESVHHQMVGWPMMPSRGVLYRSAWQSSAASRSSNFGFRIPAAKQGACVLGSIPLPAVSGISRILFKGDSSDCSGRLNSPDSNSPTLTRLMVLSVRRCRRRKACRLRGASLSTAGTSI